ncbi:SMP-30/gluconolactonase/LRE family protein [Hoeflea prorocentri]|uniref:SMP-30/gluconolactonase/LRE family protein n=1 Tax=Hoeflea prorocentri TaxID=1922333 RepID=A0A9X3UE35_9HYPH|nr:SMP-30/gluconolactonase/LRE family protein [Hoeflea prorocentri]MCY6379728.1 SMP-30/gluconolactonase/LRE family protein [Hoeflea prorocentri]MDA5397528.1 SMP-30/gluconolactonase/LRE family protein [Hoeflea prorocentri]
MSFYEVNDPVFETYVLGNAPVKQIATGFDWVEGPVWFGDANCLLFSDIPNNRIMRWSPVDGVSVYREPSNFANGHTRDRAGRLISCEHGGRRVTRTEHDGTITTIADRFDGKPLNSPNDVVVKSDGTIWFSDPHYGIMTNYEGHRSEQENACVVYRADPESGSLDQVVTDLHCPNGLAFSPDESTLYVADTGRMFGSDPQQIYAYTMGQDGRPQDGRAFHKIKPGVSDGFRVDTDGNIWSSAGDGVHCIAPGGRLLGKVLVPELVSNVCFGGRAKHQLFITATTSVYTIHLNRQGIQHP